MTDNIIWRDFEFFLSGLRNLPVSKSLTFENCNGFCVSTGCSFESWVYYPERIKNPEIVNEAINFFADKKISFMWPVYNGGEKILEDCGLIYAGDLMAMSYAGSFSEHQGSLKIYQPGLSAWAKTAWRGFGGGIDDTPENYYKLVEAFKNDKKFAIYLADYEEKHVGTFLITHEKDLMGIYYFAIVPEFRRMGFAREMMNEICRLSHGKIITLQATPMGVSFYKNFGFEERFIIPIYSTESDVF